MKQANSLDRAALDRTNPAGLDQIRVGRYKRTRYWAVWVNEELLAVTVYKKGAEAIQEALLERSAMISSIA